MAKQQFRALSRDLFFDLECTCPNKLFIGTSIEKLMNHKVTLTGYADDNFFDTVNAKPRKTKCKCGRELTYQWFRDGIIATWDKEANNG